MVTDCLCGGKGRVRETYVGFSGKRGAMVNVIVKRVGQTERSVEQGVDKYNIS